MKYCEIDDAWIEAGLYKFTTTRQVIEGKSTKRALDVHIITIQKLGDQLTEKYDVYALDDFRGIITMTKNLHKSTSKYVFWHVRCCFHIYEESTSRRPN